MRSRFALTAALTAAIVLLPATAFAQTAVGGAADAAGYMGIVLAAWFLIDKLIEISPLRENSLITAVRDFLNQMFAKKPQ
jgi:uncharacterized membrane protein